MLVAQGMEGAVVAGVVVGKVERLLALILIFQ